MPEKKTLERASKARREGKKPTTQAGAFVREEMNHVKRGKHDVASHAQAVAIGLSKARKAGVKLPAKGRTKPAGKTPTKTSTKTETKTRGRTRATKSSARQKPAR